MKDKKIKKNHIPSILVRSPTQLGNAIRRLRKLQELSQMQVAEKAGLTQATISRLEKGLQNADAGTLLLILSALQADMTITPRPAFDATEELESLF